MTAAMRHHATFGGRQGLELLERELRSKFLVHFVVPGRKQAGPVAIVGQSHREALPAVLFVLRHVSRTSEWPSSTIGGRIQRQVQDPNDSILEGHWCFPSPMSNGEIAPLVQTAWLFQCPNQWNVMVCFLVDTNQADNVAEMHQEIGQYSTQELQVLDTLKITCDNFKFKVGNMDGIEIFLHDEPLIALGIGATPRMKELFGEIELAFSIPQGRDI